MVFLVVSVIAYALNNVLWKHMLEKLSPAILITIRSFFTTLLAIALGVFLVPNIFDLSYTKYMSSMLASVIGAFGLVFMISALKEGSLKVLALYNLLTVFITATYLVIFEDFDALTYGSGSVLMLVGYFLFLFQAYKDRSKFSLSIHLKFLLMSIFFFASSLLHWYNLLQDVHPVFVAANQELVVFVFGLSFLILKGNEWHSVKSDIQFKKIFWILIMALVIFIAVYFGLLGMLEKDPLLLSLYSLAVPILTFFFGMLFFKEKVSIQSIFALITMVIAAFLLL
ncbi:MAG: EamA family transporter [Lishizhenia sp.]